MAWAAPAAPGPVHGRVVVPGSKSLTNRLLLLAALAEGPSTLHRPLVSRDAELMVGAVQQLGVQVERDPDDRTWHLTPPDRLHSGGTVDCGLAGTVLRFVPPVAALVDGSVHFDGDEQARARPITPLLEALGDLGITVDHGGRHTLPFAVHGTGRVAGGEVAVDASASSQFVSALLLAAPRFEQGLLLRHTGNVLPSMPHIEMTLEALRAAGVDASAPEPGVWRVAPGPIAGREVEVEPDLSSAAPFLCAAAATGGSVTVGGWPARTTQAGDHLRDILSTMGCSIELAESGDLTVTGPGPGHLRGLSVDLHDAGELTPVVAALCALASSPSEIRGVAHLRGHETDRLAALETELCRVGVEVGQTDDGLHIAPTRLYPAQLQTYADHRMVHFAALLALRAPGTEVLGAETVAKTFPGFERAWTSLVLGAGATATSEHPTSDFTAPQHPADMS